MSHPFPHSMALLKALTDDPPPLAPESVLASARTAYEQFLRMPPARVDDIEETIVTSGRVLWPYRKAFEALIRTKLSDEHDRFIAGLPAALRERVITFERDGGSLTDPYSSGYSRNHFVAAELGTFCAALLTARTRAAAAVRKAIAKDDTEYRKLVHEFQAIQHELEQHIEELRRLAERTADHAEVYAEIMETVHTFERGLARLAREPEAKEICATIEAYRERHDWLQERQAAGSRLKIFG